MPKKSSINNIGLPSTEYVVEGKNSVHTWTVQGRRFSTKKDAEMFKKALDQAKTTYNLSRGTNPTWTFLDPDLFDYRNVEYTTKQVQYVDLGDTDWGTPNAKH
jgi:hypothetical protein